MAGGIRKGTRVQWKWSSGTAYGKVKEVMREKVTRTIKDSEVTRNGSKDDPALLIQQEDGDEVIKLRSEVEPARK